MASIPSGCARRGRQPHPPYLIMTCKETARDLAKSVESPGGAWRLLNQHCRANGLNGAQSTWAKKKMRQLFLDETVTPLSLLANEWEVQWIFIRGNSEKATEPSWGTSVNGATTALCGSSARCMHDAMTQDYRPGEIVGHVGRAKEVASEPRTVSRCFLSCHLDAPS